MVHAELPAAPCADPTGEIGLRDYLTGGGGLIVIYNEPPTCA